MRILFLPFGFLSLTVAAVGLSVGLLAQHATGAEAPIVRKAPVAAAGALWVMGA